jgi:TetR/AcrR family transcriptional repressor of mexJK operon
LPGSKIVKSRPRGRIPAGELARHEEAFLDAASALFREHGFARVSIDMIARAARVSPKTIYSRYGGKSGLFAAVIRKMVAPALATQDILADQQNAEPIAVLRKVAAAFLERILDPEALSLHRMMIAEATHLPELSELYYKEGYGKALGRLANWLAAQDAAGLLCVPDPEVAGEIFAALAGARILDRALLLNIIPEAEERAVLLENALSIFGRAYAPRPKAAFRRRGKSRAT